jgi:hypothetical protein
MLASCSPAEMALCNNRAEVYPFERPACAPRMAVKRLPAHHGVRYQRRDGRLPGNAAYMQGHASTLARRVVTIGNRSGGPGTSLAMRCGS